MPTYEYGCTDPECLHEWEEVQHLADPVLLVCPKCGAQTASRHVGGAGGFRLKGTCWAKDGYVKK